MSISIMPDSVFKDEVIEKVKAVYLNWLSKNLKKGERYDFNSDNTNFYKIKIDVSATHQELLAMYSTIGDWAENQYLIDDNSNRYIGKIKPLVRKEYLNKWLEANNVTIKTQEADNLIVNYLSEIEQLIEDVVAEIKLIPISTFAS